MARKAVEITFGEQDGSRIPVNLEAVENVLGDINRRTRRKFRAEE